MRKVNYSFPAGGVEAGSEGKEGAGASQARLLILCHREEGIHAQKQTRFEQNRAGNFREGGCVGKVALCSKKDTEGEDRGKTHWDMRTVPPGFFRKCQ